jgi:hypothetical protein
MSFPAQHVATALAGLSEKQRAAVQLCWLEHTPASAAAEHLPCSTNVLKKRLRQAKHLLRVRLQDLRCGHSEPPRKKFSTTRIFRGTVYLRKIIEYHVCSTDGLGA